MLLTHNELVQMTREGIITARLDQVKGASIDVTLGNNWITENQRGGTVDLGTGEGPKMTKHNAATYTLSPGEFILAQSQEVFYLPNDIAAMFTLRSSLARAGLDHAHAVWADPGLTGSVLTFELKNNLQHHQLRLLAGMPIGQMIFFKGEPVPMEKSYRINGRYNNDRSATMTKGI